MILHIICIQWGQKRYRESNQFSSFSRPGQSKVMPPLETSPDEKSVLFPPQKMRNYFRSVSEHKDVTKLVMMLTSSVNSFREQITLALKDYDTFSSLWERDREEVSFLSFFYDFTVGVL